MIDTHFIFSSNLLISIFLSSSTKMHFGGIDAVRTIDNIEYLHAYKELLDAIEEGNKSRITTAEKNCALMKMSMPFGGNTEEMEAYARYIYLIEKSLSE